jgi:hypothetical protein
MSFPASYSLPRNIDQPAAVLTVVSCGRIPARRFIKTVNLKTGMPLVHQAMQHLDRALAVARQEKCTLLKLIHGYGSSGAGGDIRIAAQKHLAELVGRSQIRGCIFGENWTKSDEQAWALLNAHPELKEDPDLGRRNRGITIVLL